MSKEQLFQLLPLPDDGLQQVLDYAATLSKAEAAEHFSNLLGDSPQVIEFISTFNARRAEPKAPTATSAAPAATSSAQSSEIDAVSKQRPRQKKKTAPLHTPPPRQVASFALGPGTVYNKKDQEEDYMSGRRGTSTPPSKPAPAKSATPPPSKPSKPSTGPGTLVSDLGLPKSKQSKSRTGSRTSTPGPSSRNSSTTTTKVSITGGVPMHGPSTALADLDQAIRALELTANTAQGNTAEALAARRCNCVATRHPLLDAAPNCLSCGKVVCVREGLGPCTFCGARLVSEGEARDMIRELREERGRERMRADREANAKRGGNGAAQQPTYLRGRTRDDLTVAEAMALQHRDKLLGFQAQNAKRTVVRDEAADFDVGFAGAAGSMWATPEERALALKRQQRLMREMEWNAKPEYEKRQQVVSIDLSGRKVFKKTVKMERPAAPEEEEEQEGDEEEQGGAVLRETDGNRGRGQGEGAFSKNPLLGGLIRPVYHVERKEGEVLEGRKDRSTRWRRVQDDMDDNEAVILDGGLYGGSGGGDFGIRAGAAGDEPGCG
ncbi:hypothetical protein VTK26DRAFT_6332 [Humicola hyalothermophila]